MRIARVRLFLLAPMLGAAAMGAAAPPAPISFARPASTNNEPEKRPGWERARVNQTCEGCHVEIAAEWRESRHHVAFTNQPFQRSLAREAPAMRPFCQGCHAPESSPLVPPSDLVGGLGVGCVTCHAPQGPVLAGNGSGTAPHSLLRTPAFSTVEACASCHDFLFPGASGRAGLRMQRTLGEHEKTEDGRTCSDCHMPLEKGPRPHKSHRFPGGYDEAMLKSALDIRAERPQPTRVRVHLKPVGVTHAMPTGDLFRRLAVEVFSGESNAEKGGVVYLARHFQRGFGMREVEDDRVHELTRSIDLDVPPGPVRIRVRYERVAHHRGADERDAEVESSVVISELSLPQ